MPNSKTLLFLFVSNSVCLPFHWWLFLSRRNVWRNKFMAFQCRFFFTRLSPHTNSKKVVEENERVFNSKSSSSSRSTTTLPPTPACLQVLHCGFMGLMVNNNVKWFQRNVFRFSRFLACTFFLFSTLWLNVMGNRELQIAFYQTISTSPRIMLIKSCKRESICPMLVNYFPGGLP